MHKYILENFDWTFYDNTAQSRFLDGREGAILSYGFHNVVAIGVVLALCWWAFGLWVELYAIKQTMEYMQDVRRVLHLNELAEFADDLVLLTKEHFNMIVKSRQNTIPTPVARIRMPSTLNLSTLKVCHDAKQEGDEKKNDKDKDTLETPFADKLGVSFTFDCNRTTFVSAHWGVPLSILQDICVEKDSQIGEARADDLYIRRFLQNIFSSIFRKGAERLLETNPTAFLDETDSRNDKLGCFNLLTQANRLCSTGPACYDAGSNIQCTMSPTTKTIEVDGQKHSVWDILLRKSYKGEQIIPLVIVLYSPRAQETRLFAEGGIESYQGIAEITLVTFKGSLSSLVKTYDEYGAYSDIRIETEKKVCFSNDYKPPQEPREMYGMGETDNECLICIANRMDTLLLPCGHASFCSSCLKSLRNEKCPVCRGEFTSYIKFPLTNATN